MENDRIGPERGTALTELPAEIMFMITDHISQVDVACLALCNHKLLSVLGRDTWISLHSKPQALFLERLARDRPSYFFCYLCFILHFRGDINPPGPALRPNKYFPLHRWSVPTINRSLDVHLETSHYTFSIFHLQLAMKRYYYGPQHGISTESLQFTEVQVEPRSSITTLLSVEARICDGPSLCLRIQNWALADTPGIDRLILKTKLISICDHVKMDGERPILPRLIKSAFEKYIASKQSRIPVGPDVFTCRTCGTDYQVEVKRFSNNRLALVMTKWLDLGAGLDPKDIRWKRHSEVRAPVDLRAVRSPRGILSLFERAAGPSLDSITRKNELYLLDNNYKESMDWWTDGTWILQAGKRLPPTLGDAIVHLLVTYLWQGCIGAIAIALLVYFYILS
ncbi:hypothetical protein FQN49_007592 [Arthroderma sp. PD_2]|nr:hypothetical protein FQN49_007592 [Arthroderma sp. PD_2]